MNTMRSTIFTYESATFRTVNYFGHLTISKYDLCSLFALNSWGYLVGYP